MQRRPRQSQTSATHHNRKHRTSERKHHGPGTRTQGDFEQAIVSLGSNVEKERHLPEAIRLLRRHRSIDVKAVSRIFESAAEGGPPDAPTFFNAAMLVCTDLSPEELRTELRRSRMFWEECGLRTRTRRERSISTSAISTGTREGLRRVESSRSRRSFRPARIASDRRRCAGLDRPSFRILNGRPGAGHHRNQGRADQTGSRDPTERPL